MYYTTMKDLTWDTIKHFRRWTLTKLYKDHCRVADNPCTYVWFKSRLSNLWYNLWKAVERNSTSLGDFDFWYDKHCKVLWEDSMSKRQFRARITKRLRTKWLEWCINTPHCWTWVKVGTL